ncbi:UNVERIFIED_CONTAM: hypothetical protein HHA_456080 [Hammondia hammondi]|eukprot:XP_008888920.1 hypothetical protein HHA_456080 [Hammondia hammondi]
MINLQTYRPIVMTEHRLLAANKLWWGCLYGDLSAFLFTLQRPLRCSFLHYAASSIVTFECLLGFSGYRIASRKHSASNDHGYPNEVLLAPVFSVDTLVVQQARMCSGTRPQSNDTKGGSHLELDVNLYDMTVAISQKCECCFLRGSRTWTTNEGTARDIEGPPQALLGRQQQHGCRSSLFHATREFHPLP